MLSDREKQVLRLAAQGLADKQIVRRRGISKSTVKGAHRQHLPSHQRPGPTRRRPLARET